MRCFLLLKFLKYLRTVSVKLGVTAMSFIYGQMRFDYIETRNEL